VPTLSGNINLTIPPDSQSGKRLRVKDKGLASKTGIGDLYAVLKIVIPDKTDEESRQLWKTLSEKTKFNPRREWRTA